MDNNFLNDVLMPYIEKDIFSYYLYRGCYEYISKYENLRRVVVVYLICILSVCFK